ncbi:hypothetical protein BDZ85DRAFT_286377 [Elsinoe ampelina]|uniref:Uncharacterized protein n=1 Tax=Elsinoe ampelina TaxID=302913 RepID=A0A6A6FYQ4_9PEZI|nr:hypothetical protein BDZ85DRAFT_286377 [Elsinoe ampelina]
MPVKWDSTKDQFLLVQLTEDIALDPAQTKRIRDRWPSAWGDKPTERAIKEHFVRLRSNLGKAGVDGFATTGAKGTGKGAGVPKTPLNQKATAGGVTKPKPKAKPAAKKRKRNQSPDSEDADADMTMSDTDGVEQMIKQEGEGESEMAITPRHVLARKTKSPEEKEKKAKYVREMLGESSASSEDEAGPGEEGEYNPVKDEMV